MSKKLTCQSCGPIEYVLIDGYNFGDRLLDGCCFKVAHIEDEPKCIGIAFVCEDYFSCLNKEKWFNACEEYCKDLDIATCPICYEDCYVGDIWYNKNNKNS